LKTAAKLVNEMKRVSVLRIRVRSRAAHKEAITIAIYLRKRVLLTDLSGTVKISSSYCVTPTRSTRVREAYHEGVTVLRICRTKNLTIKVRKYRKVETAQKSMNL
jgi:hypothetical protein